MLLQPPLTKKLIGLLFLLLQVGTKSNTEQAVERARDSFKNPL